MCHTQTATTGCEYRVFLLVYRNAAGELVKSDFLDLCDSGMDPLSTLDVDQKYISIDGYQIAIFEYLEGFDDDDGNWTEPTKWMCTLCTSHPQKTVSSELVYTAEQFVQKFSRILFHYIIRLLPKEYAPIRDDPTDTVPVDYDVVTSLNETVKTWG